MKSGNQGLGAGDVWDRCLGWTPAKTTSPVRGRTSKPSPGMSKECRGWGGVGIYSGERLKPSGSLDFPYAHWWESSSLGIDANKDGDIFLGIACPSWKRFNLFPGNNCSWTMLKLLSSFVHVPDEVRCETVVGNQLKQFWEIVGHHHPFYHSRPQCWKRFGLPQWYFRMARTISPPTIITWDVVLNIQP